MPFQAIKHVMVRHRTLVHFSAAFIVYALCTLFYMGGAVTDCSEALLSFPGDNTAGLIAMFTIDSHDPWFSYTHVYSYPYGEVLGQPTHITAQTLFVPFWALAKVFGPVCGFNVLTMIGFMSAALVTFAFVRWLFNARFLVALLAGFAVAFTPYLQIKTGVHISYVFEALFIAIIWLFLLLWKDPSWKRAVLAGLAVAACAYTDGYFILLGGVLTAALVVGLAGYDFFSAGRKVTDALRQRVRALIIAGVAAAVCMLPVLYIMYSSAGQINQSLSSTRDSIGNEAQVYGARPLEYLLPNPMNPVLSPVFGDYASRDNHGSNPAENMLSLSLVMLGLAVFFVVQVVRRWTQPKRLERLAAQYDPRFILVVFGAILVAALTFSLPPKLGPFPTPTDVLIHVVALWRVFARLGVIVNIAVVIMASGGLLLLLERIKGAYWRIGVCLLALLLVFVEYLTFTPPRQVSGYEKVPELYYWLHDQSAYKEIAEYPLDEFAASGTPVFYNTYQRIHGKKLLNGVISGEDAVFARAALRDLQRPQSVPGLRTLGIDFIIIHSPTNPGPIPGLRLTHVSKESMLTTNGKPNKVWGYAVEPGDRAGYVVAPTAGFHAPLIKGPVHQVQKMGHEGVVKVRQLKGSAARADTVQLSLELQALPPKGQEIAIIQGKQTLWRGLVPASGMTIDVNVQPGKDIHVKAINPTTDATLLLPSMSVRQ